MTRRFRSTFKALGLVTFTALTHDNFLARTKVKDQKRYILTLRTEISKPYEECNETPLMEKTAPKCHVTMKNRIDIAHLTIKGWLIKDE